MKFKKKDKYSGNIWLTTRIDWHSKFIVKLSLISWLPDRGRISPNLSVWKRERSIYANIAPIVIFNPLQVFVPNEAELYNPKHDWPNRQGLTDFRNFCFKIIFIVLGWYLMEELQYILESHSPGYGKYECLFLYLHF